MLTGGDNVIQIKNADGKTVIVINDDGSQTIDEAYFQKLKEEKNKDKKENADG